MTISFILQAGNLSSERLGICAEVTQLHLEWQPSLSSPQGPLHYEAQSDVLPPLSFSYSESKIPLLPQKTTVKLLLLSLTPNFSLPGNN